MIAARGFSNAIYRRLQASTKTVALVVDKSELEGLPFLKHLSQSR
jgi:hypothetical protein